MSGPSWTDLAGRFPEAILLLSGGGVVRSVNGSGRRLLGRNGVAGTSLEALVREDGEQVRSSLAAWRRSGSLLPAPLTFLASDGASIAVTVQGGLLDPVGDRDGGPLLLVRLRERTRGTEQFLVLNQKITELTREIGRRRRAESILEGQRAVLESIGRSSPLDGTLAQIVSLLERWTEGSIGSILLVEAGRLRHGAAPGLPAAYTEAIDGVEIGPEVGSCGSAAYLGEPVLVAEIATDHRWSDFADLAAAHGLAACWSVPVRGSDGVVLGSIAMYHGSPRQASPEDLEMMAIAARLAAIAIERKRTERALQVRAEELLDADRRKNEFLAMLAHELRNPLAAVATTLAVLEKAPARVPEQLGRLDRQVRHLGRLVDDLLEVSRVARGLVELERRPLELWNLVREAVDGFASAFEQAGLGWGLDLPDGEVWVDGDRDRLLQVLGNLLSNAVRYTPAGGRVELEGRAEPDGARVEVRDTGQGIAPDFLPRIFDAFTQAERPLDRRQGGLGIGLTLVRSLVLQHGGTVEVASAGPGLGSTFTVRLPRVAAPTTSPSLPPLPPAKETSLAVLVVEDHEDNARALGELVRLWGHRCTVVSSGAEALARVESLRPDVVLLDIGLPEVDGYEVALRMRELPDLARGRCVLVAVTGYGREEDRRRAEAAGFDEHLTKPLDLERLESLLASVARR